MSSIVKAKWVTINNTPVAIHVQEHSEIEMTSEIQITENDTTVVDDNRPDPSVEVMRSANEMMKQAINESREIKEKSQVDGYKEGYSQGYDNGHEEGLRDGSQEGFQAGFNDGLEEGMAKAAEAVELKLQELNELFEAVEQERQRARENQQQEMLDISFEIAKKIMKHQVAEDRDLFLKFFDEVIHGDEEDLKIYLSENQKTLGLHINREMSEKLKKLAKKSKVIILKDEDKIMVETNDSVIDMSLPVQLDQLEKAIEQSS